MREKALEKLNMELEEHKEPYFQLVLKRMIMRINDSESLAEDVMQEGKNIKDCFQYIKNKARKLAKDGCAAVEDHIVYEWAEDYYREEVKAEEKKEESQKYIQPIKEIKHIEMPRKIEEPKEPVKKPDKKQMEGQMDIFSLFGFGG